MPGPDFGVNNWSNCNCYAYALHMPNGGMLYPGEAAGYTTSKSVSSLRMGIVRDGGIRYILQGEPPAGTMPGYYLLAMKVDTGGGNFHAMRRDETTGIWYQKPPIGTPGKMPDDFTPHQDSWWTGAAVAMEANGALAAWVGYFWIRNPKGRSAKLGAAKADPKVAAGLTVM